MNPDLEFFLEKTIGGVAPTSPEIGRVVVEPDYDVAPDTQDADRLGIEFVRILRESKPDKAAMATLEGQEIRIPEFCPLIRKYIRRVTLHADKVEGDWIEVAPPGNWI